MHGDAIGATRTDAWGHYTFTVNFGQRGIVRPARQGEFIPSEYPFTASGDRGDLDFVAAPNQTPGGTTTSLKASSVSKTQINLDWVDNSSSGANSQLERCLGAGCRKFRLIAIFSPNLTSYGDAGLAANTTYRYRVRTSNGVGSFSYSNIAQATTKP